MIKRNLFLLLVGVYFIFALVSYLTAQQDDLTGTFVQFVYLGAPLLAFCGALRTAHVCRLESAPGKTYFLFACGMLSFFVGEVFWIIFELTEITPSPSIADFFYITAYLFLFTALLFHLRVYKIRFTDLNFNWQLLLIGLGIVFTIVVSYFGIYLAYDPQETWLLNMINIFYGVADLILLICTLFILQSLAMMRQGKLVSSWVIVFSGFVGFLVADISYAINYEEYINVVWWARQLDLLWILAYLGIGYGCFLAGTTIRAVQTKLEILKSQPNICEKKN